MSRVTETPKGRMSAEARRELVLEAATRAFARGGYAGTSTDAVGKEAGVSQPYVVRIFGTKQQLFLEVLGRTCETIRAAFAAVIAEGFDPDDPDPLEHTDRPANGRRLHRHAHRGRVRLGPRRDLGRGAQRRLLHPRP